MPTVSPPAAAANTAPVCADVTASVENYDNPDSLLPPPSVTIVAACSDPDPGTTLQYAGDGSPPPGGYAAYNPAGFTYYPKSGFYGTDTFGYVASDGTNISNVATVTVTVLRPVPDDRDHDGIPTKDDLCPDAAASRSDGCPDTDGDGLPDKDDDCPAEAAAGRDDGCPPVVDDRAWGRESRRQAQRLGRRWHRPAERARAWRTNRISILVHVPESAATGRQLRVGAIVRPVRRLRDGPLPSVMFGKGVRCEPGQSRRVTLRLRATGFKFARHRKLELHLILSPHDGHGVVDAVAPLKLSPRR